MTLLLCSVATPPKFPSIVLPICQFSCCIKVSGRYWKVRIWSCELTGEINTTVTGGGLTPSSGKKQAYLPCKIKQPTTSNSPGENAAERVRSWGSMPMHWSHLFDWALGKQFVHHDRSPWGVASKNQDSWVSCNCLIIFTSEWLLLI